MNFAIVIIVFFILLTVLEYLARCTSLEKETIRKIGHAIAGTIVFFTPWYLHRIEIIVLAFFFTGVLAISKKGRLLSIHNVSRQTLGEVYFPLGIALSALLFLPIYRGAFQFGLLVLAISDTFAALVGIRFGKNILKILGNKKSLEGSFMFFITTLCIVVGFTGTINFHLISLSIILTLTEFLLVFGLDNLILPSLSAYLFTLLA